MAKRRATPLDLANLTADLCAAWLPPEPAPALPDSPYAACADASSLLRAVGVDGAALLGAYLNRFKGALDE